MAKLYLLFLGILLLSVIDPATAQNVGIGTVSPNTSAQLDISSASRGLLIPRMNTAGINAIPNPAKGLMVYDSAMNQLMVNMGTASSPSWQTVVLNSGWSLTGNSGTNPSSQFIGNTDNKALNFRVNNTQAGQLDPMGNIFWGLRAGQGNISAGSNIAIGTDALKSNQYGLQLVAIGDSALYNNTGGNIGGNYQSGSSNTAVGWSALYSNTIGYRNTAVGGQALLANTTGTDNVGVGHWALHYNMDGSGNVGVGEFALWNNVSGNSNLAVGNGALANNNDVLGSYNTAVGGDALYNTTASEYNTALGYNAGYYFNLGYNNTFLGANTRATADGIYNCIAIGQDVQCTASNQVRIGNLATSSIGGTVGWSTLSDGRLKKDVTENVKGLDFILKLRPVTYRLDMAAMNQRLSGKTDARKKPLHTDPTENESRVLTGFVAQEVEQASRLSGFDFGGIDKPKNENDLYGLRYADFVVPLVKATQELNALVSKQQAIIDDLQRRLAALEKEKTH